MLLDYYDICLSISQADRICIIAKNVPHSGVQNPFPKSVSFVFFLQLVKQLYYTDTWLSAIYDTDVNGDMSEHNVMTEVLFCQTYVLYW